MYAFTEPLTQNDGEKSTDLSTSAQQEDESTGADPETEQSKGVASITLGISIYT